MDSLTVEERPRGTAPDVERYRTPGIYYVEGVSDDSVRQEPSGVPVFVGWCRTRLPQPDPVVRFTRWAQFEAWSGPGACPGFLADAVRGFFANGGERCAVVPLLPRATAAERAGAMTRPMERGGLLEDLEDIDLVCLPDAMGDALADSGISVALEIQASALEHCARIGDRFAILDSRPDSPTRVDEGLAHVTDQWNALPPREGALYFPWICVEPGGGTPIVTGRRQRGRTAPRELRVVPPCGHVAGVYARVDARAGVHRAPANEVLEGVVDLARHLSDGDQAGLNDHGVNCLRSFPGRGIRIWGARTLSGRPEWQFVNVSRQCASLRRWLQRGLLDLVFEPNGPALWNNVRDRLRSHCLGLYESGALRGTSADQAFFVKCDAETNPLDIREAGALVAQIGLALVAPLEFVVVQITRHVGGSIETQPTTL